MTCHRTEMSRTSSTSRIHREEIQANGHNGSNQKSACVMSDQNHPARHPIPHPQRALATGRGRAAPLAEAS